MALEWVSASQESVAFGAPIKDDTEAALILKGLFIGLNSDGDAVLANGTGTGDKVEAKGAAWDDGYITGGGDTVYLSRVGFVRTNKIYGFSGLTEGGVVYLNSGGGITQTEPATSGNIKQVVGFAITADTIFVDIEPGETVA